MNRTRSVFKFTSSFLNTTGEPIQAVMRGVMCDTLFGERFSNVTRVYRKILRDILQISAVLAGVCLAIYFTSQTKWQNGTAQKLRAPRV